MIKLLEQRVEHINGLLKSGGLAGPPEHMQQMRDLRREYQVMISQQRAKFAPARKGKGKKTEAQNQRSRGIGSTILRDVSPRLKAYEPVRSSSTISQGHGALAKRDLNDSAL